MIAKNVKITVNCIPYEFKLLPYMYQNNLWSHFSHVVQIPKPLDSNIISVHVYGRYVSTFIHRFLKK